MNESTPLVSVIIPCYNSARFLITSIGSVLSQTYSPIEIIVVNDGSTDNTEEVVSSIKCANLRYFRQENGGVSSARNLGIKQARGEYIRFLDADDELPADSIQKQVVHALSLKDNQISVGGYRLNDVRCLPSSNIMAMYSCCQFFIPRELLLEVNGFDTNLRVAEDLELTIKLKAKGYVFVPILEVLYFYHFGVNPESLVAVSGEKYGWGVIRYIFEKYKDNHKRFATDREYNNYFIDNLFLGGNEEDYLFLRKKLPFNAHPCQFRGSKILGYLLWFISYVVPFDITRRCILKLFYPKISSWLANSNL